MKYSQVCLEAFGYTLPEEVVSTADLERQLAPGYERLRLPEGRLQLMTGIQERRFYSPGTTPGSVSGISAANALEASGLDPKEIGALIHGSVCRDFLEPATACGVHHALGLPQSCMIYDVSNACLGVLTGIVQLANMIELGQIKAGIVVGTECGRTLVENTIKRINEDASVTRKNIKLLVASLTIGSGSVAAVLCHASLSKTGNQLLGGAVTASTDHHELCQSEGLETFMQTDSEQLMRRGVAAGGATFDPFLAELDWTREDIDRTVCHQVGVAHRKLLFEKLRLDERLDVPTLETLGNTGAAALPLTMALGAEAGQFQRDDSVALLGIGSGINCQMLGVRWQESRVVGNAKQLQYEPFVAEGPVAESTTATNSTAQQSQQ